VWNAASRQAFLDLSVRASQAERRLRVGTHRRELDDEADSGRFVATEALSRNNDSAPFIAGPRLARSDKSARTVSIPAA